MKRRITIKALSLILSLMSMSSVIKAGGTDINVPKNRYSFLPAVLNEKDKKELFPGVNVKFHDDKYWEEDITLLWLSKVGKLKFNYATGWHSQTQLDNLKKMLEKIFETELHFSDHHLEKILDKVNYFFIQDDFEYEELEEERDERKSELFKSKYLTRANLIELISDTCFRVMGQGSSTCAFEWSMGNNKYNCSCFLNWLSDFYEFPAVKDEIKLRNSGIPYDCKLAFISFTSKYVKLAENLLLNFVQSMAQGNNDIIKSVVNDVNFQGLKARCDLWLNSSTIDEFFVNFERFISYTYIDCGCDLKDIVKF